MWREFWEHLFEPVVAIVTDLLWAIMWIASVVLVGAAAWEILSGISQ